MVDDPSAHREMTAEAHFPPVDVSVRQARRWAREALGPRSEQVPRDVVDLVVTELVANAVVHARTPFAVRLAWSDSGLLVEVEDRSGEVPRELRFAPDATAGRGVSMVRRLAERSGVEHDDAHKRVWAEVPLESTDSWAPDR